MWIASWFVIAPEIAKRDVKRSGELYLSATTKDKTAKITATK